MIKKQKRDNAYYEERLRNDYPAIYADQRAGKHKTLTKALIAAGLKTPRTRLQELKNAFEKANKAERTAFLGWLAAKAYSVTAGPAPGGAGPVIAINRRLLPATKIRIEDIIAKRNLKMGDVMAEMGFPKLNASLGRALHRGDKLQPDVITALETWLVANGSV